MKILLRNSLAILLGLVVGAGVNMLIISLGPYLVPPPPGVDVTDTESIAASIQLYGPEHFVIPFLAHAFGTLVGALAAYLIGANHYSILAFAIGAIFLLGGISASFMIPAPDWFVVLDLGFAYLPMAWVGILLGRRIKEEKHEN